ncbi:Uncharacterised protein [Pseudomonas putida]|nr:Uncharacterised protein [Pseudomonas putida]
MKIQRESMKLFYKGGYIHTSLCTQGSRTVFRGAGQLLAELRVGRVKCVGLLSVDYAGSVLGVTQERKREQYAYTTYGHCSSLPSGHSLLGSMVSILMICPKAICWEMATDYTRL